MKIKTLKPIRKSFYFSKILILFILLFELLSVKAQPPFDNRYGSLLQTDDGVGSEFVTCPSIDGDYTYAAVGSIWISSPGPGQNATYGVRGVRIKADGTMLTTTFDFIQESSLEYNIFPLKIIPINSNTEYLITGYVTRVSGIFAAPLHPFPFVIKADADLNATAFKIFSDHEGFFTDVDEIPNSNGDLLFSGAQSSLTSITPASRVGWILRTDPTNFTAQWMRFIHNSQRTSGHNYHIVHDAIALDGDNAIICGTTNEVTDCSPPKDSFQARAFIAKIDLSNGAFVWHKSIYRGRLGIRLAINNGNNGTQMICMATHGEISNSLAGLSFFQMDGTFISDKICEVNTPPMTLVYFNHNVVPEYPSSIYIHDNHIIQNIYFMDNDEDVFISGKFVKTKVTYSSTDYGYYDMPYSMVFDYSNLSYGNVSLYKTAQTFPSMLPTFLSYNLWLINDCPGHRYPQFYTASNTLPCLSGCGTDEFITVTLDKAGEDGNLTNMSEDKVWIFSNDQYACGQNSKAMETHDLTYQDHINIENDFIEIAPDVDDLSFYNTDPDRYIFGCVQYTP